MNSDILLCNCITTYAQRDINLLFKCIDSLHIDDTNDAALLIHIDNYIDPNEYEYSENMVGYWHAHHHFIDEIVLKYNTIAFIPLVTDHRINVSESRNKLMRACKKYYDGAFVRFIDDDDISEPSIKITNMIRQQLKLDNSIKIIKTLMTTMIRDDVKSIPKYGDKSNSKSGDKSNSITNSKSGDDKSNSITNTKPNSITNLITNAKSGDKSNAKPNSKSNPKHDDRLDDDKSNSISNSKSNAKSGDKSNSITNSKSNAKSGDKSNSITNSKSNAKSGDKSNAKSNPISNAKSGDKSNTKSSFPLFVFKDCHTTIFHTSLTMIEFPDFIPNEDLMWNYFLFLYCLENNIRVKVVDKVTYHITGHSNSWIDDSKLDITPEKFKCYEKYVRNINWIIVAIKCRQKLSEHYAFCQDDMISGLKGPYIINDIKYRVNYSEFAKKQRKWHISSKLLNYDITTSLLYLLSERENKNRMYYTVFMRKKKSDLNDKYRIKLLNRGFNNLYTVYDDQLIKRALKRLKKKSNVIISYNRIYEIINKQDHS